mmetsp:Transcript_2172/g.14370  ORF Transcript_2172/g.14370 Transcript_2172/m.14370 type:complete len:100 (-) Transcript_2172:1820-2119(-)
MRLSSLSGTYVAAGYQVLARIRNQAGGSFAFHSAHSKNEGGNPLPEDLACRSIAMAIRAQVVHEAYAHEARFEEEALGGVLCVETWSSCHLSFLLYRWG